MEMSFEQFKQMKVGDLVKIAEDYERVCKELQYIKAKYPRAKEEVESEKEKNINKFLEEL